MTHPSLPIYGGCEVTNALLTHQTLFADTTAHAHSGPTHTRGPRTLRLPSPLPFFCCRPGPATPPDVIAVNQDYAGHSGSRFLASGRNVTLQGCSWKAGVSCDWPSWMAWYKPLSGR